MKGLLFDIQEFTVHDGPGARTTLFFKGCPMRCQWCHNPEGQLCEPELMESPNRCSHCNLCRKKCQHPECQKWGRCIHACPQGLLKVAGTWWTAQALADKIDYYATMTAFSGITLSGGEPLMQAPFIMELLDRIPSVHTALQTAGFCDAHTFCKVIERVDYVLYDLKLADPVKHKQYTGVDNAQILENYRLLLKSGKPHVVRIPLIPQITDTQENIKALACISENSMVELMQYNQCAGAKYPMLGRSYSLSEKTPNNVDASLFKRACFV